MTAAPTPCTSRPPIRVGRVGARPHRSEPRPKTMNPAPKTRRYPHMSPSRPDGKQQRRDGHQVGGGDPADVAEGRLVLRLDLGDDDVDDAAVQRPHEGAGAGHDEDKPPVAVADCRPAFPGRGGRLFPGRHGQPPRSQILGIILFALNRPISRLQSEPREACLHAAGGIKMGKEFQSEVAGGAHRHHLRRSRQPDGAGGGAGRHRPGDRGRPDLPGRPGLQGPAAGRVHPADPGAGHPLPARQHGRGPGDGGRTEAPAAASRGVLAARPAPAQPGLAAGAAFGCRRGVPGRAALLPPARGRRTDRAVRPRLAAGRDDRHRADDGPDEIRPLLREEQADWIIAGHVHQAYAFRFEGAGSPTRAPSVSPWTATAGPRTPYWTPRGPASSCAGWPTTWTPRWPRPGSGASTPIPTGTARRCGPARGPRTCNGQARVRGPSHLSS